MGGMVNYYVLVGDDGESLILIDTAHSGEIVGALESALPSIGRTIENITHVLITHPHYDHVGGLAALQKRLPNVRTYASAIDAPIIEKQVPPVMADPATLPAFDRFVYNQIKGGADNFEAARVDRPIELDDMLEDVPADLCIIDLHGHSNGQIGFFVRDERALFGGDVVMHMPHGITRPIRAVSPDWTAAQDSIRRVIDLSPATLLIGHGAPLSGDVSGTLRTRFG